jgi:predicted nucleic acid-binding protein
MSGWFADASVLLARADARDPEHEAAAALLAGPAAVATIDLAYYEVTNVALRAWRSPELAAVVRRLVAALTEDGGLVRVDEQLIAAAADVAQRHELSAYDAAYVAGAVSVGARLVSCDEHNLVASGLAITPSEAVAG